MLQLTDRAWPTQGETDRKPPETAGCVLYPNNGTAVPQPTRQDKMAKWVSDTWRGEHWNIPGKADKVTNERDI